MTSATPCPTCGGTLNGAVCCPDCGTPVEDHRDTGPGPLPPTAERLPARRDTGAMSAPLPELAALPPEAAPAPTAPLPALAGDFAGGPVSDDTRAAVPPRSRRTPAFGRAALAAVLVAAVAGGGAVVLALGDTEQRESAPVPKRPQQTRQTGPDGPAAPLPTATPSPRVTGSDPLPPEPTRTVPPAPAPPAPTPSRDAPAPPSRTPGPEFSWPSGWPTPTACGSGWCWPQNRGRNGDGTRGPGGS